MLSTERDIFADKLIKDDSINNKPLDFNFFFSFIDSWNNPNPTFESFCWKKKSRIYKQTNKNSTDINEWSLNHWTVTQSMHAHVESVTDASIINKIKLPTVLSRLEMLIIVNIVNIGFVSPALSSLCPHLF